MSTGFNPFVVRPTNKEYVPGDNELCPHGAIPGNVVAFLDLGTQRDNYQGKIQINRKVALVYEIWNAAVRKQNGESFFFVQIYNFPSKFSKQSKLRIDLEAVLGRSFQEGEDLDITVVLGQPCTIAVVHTPGTDKNGKPTVYANLDGIGPVPFGVRPTASVRPVLWYHEMATPFPSGPQYGWFPRSYANDLESIWKQSDECRSLMAEHFRNNQAYQAPQQAPQAYQAPQQAPAPGGYLPPGQGQVSAPQGPSGYPQGGAPQQPGPGGYQQPGQAPQAYPQAYPQPPQVNPGYPQAYQPPAPPVAGPQVAQHNFPTDRMPQAYQGPYGPPVPSQSGPQTTFTGGPIPPAPGPQGPGDVRESVSDDIPF